jgi:hypothetical protein
MGHGARVGVVVMAAVVTAVVAMAVVMAAAGMPGGTAVATSGAMAVDTSGVVTSADVILPADIMAALTLARVTSAGVIGLRAGTSSVVEIILVTTHSAIDTNGIVLPGSAGPAGAPGVAGGAVGEAGLDRCSGHFFWETYFRARFGRTSTATRSGPTARPLPMTTAPMCQLTAMAVLPIFMAMPRAKETIAVVHDQIRSRPT